VAEPFSLADLQIVRPPGGGPYAEVEDRHAEALLEANGFGRGPDELRRAIDSGVGVIVAAAARVAGITGDEESLDLLAELRDPLLEETVLVQVGYALARNERPRGIEMLAEQLEVDPATSPAPLQAAGALARLGDPRGWPLVLSALESGDDLNAMVACKQLFAFRDLDGQATADGSRVDVDAGYRAALGRGGSIADEARLQLREHA